MVPAEEFRRGKRFRAMHTEARRTSEQYAVIDPRCELVRCTMDDLLVASTLLRIDTMRDQVDY